MKFIEILNEKRKRESIEEKRETSVINDVSQVSIREKEKKPEEILRGNGIKIRLITRTAFGIQIDLAKAYEDEKIRELLSDFNIKIRDKSVFIVT